MADRIQAQNASLSWAVETSPGSVESTPADNVWHRIEWNQLNRWANDFTKSTQVVNSPDRQMKEGSTTGVTSGAAFELNTTFENMRNFAPYAVMARTVRGDGVDIGGNAIDAANDEVTGITALTAAQAAFFPAQALAYIQGSSIDSNNGLKTVETAAAANDTEIAFAESLIADAGNISVTAAGLRVDSATNVTWDYDAASDTATMTLANHGLAAMGLEVGQGVHIGRFTGQGKSRTRTAGFTGPNAEVIVGRCTVRAITSGTVVFEDLDPELKFDDTTSPNTDVDILFGETWQNVDVTHPRFNDSTVQLENQYQPRSGSSIPIQYDYAEENFLNEMTISMPRNAKSTMTLDFIGSYTESAVAEADRRSVQANYVLPRDRTTMSTATDMGKINFRRADGSLITNTFTEATLSIGNNVNTEGVLAQVEAGAINYATLSVNLTAQVWLERDVLPEVIEYNEAASFSCMLRNKNGAMIFNIPSMDVSSGSKIIEIGTTVRVNVNGAANDSNRFRKSVIMSSIYGLYDG